MGGGLGGTREVIGGGLEKRWYTKGKKESNEGAMVTPRAPHAEVDVSLPSVQHNLFRQGHSGLRG